MTGRSGVKASATVNTSIRSPAAGADTLGTVARQFGLPTGRVGRLVGRFMSRNNGNLNRWLVEQVAAAVPVPRSVVEVGSGPGVGAAGSACRLPPRPSRRRRPVVRAAIAGRTAPVDLVVAVHVLYFWHQPHRDLKLVAELLDHGGRVALGYQLKRHMPARLSATSLPPATGSTSQTMTSASCCTRLGFRPRTCAYSAMRRVQAAACCSRRWPK